MPIRSEDEARWDQPDLIARLEAVNTRARTMWTHSHNDGFYMPPSFLLSDDSLSTPEAHMIREDTPSSDSKADTRQLTEPELHLRFGSTPRSPADGFVFGSDRELCDIYLGSKAHLVSSRAFAITFNEQNELIMNTFSGNPTTVEFQGQKPFHRTHFTYILHSQWTDVTVTVAESLVFKIHIPSRPRFREAYVLERKPFLDRCHNGFLDSNPLRTIAGTYTTRNTEHENTTRAQNPYYPTVKELGAGGFGTVFKARQMPSGATVAAKQLMCKGRSSEWKDEIIVLKSLAHLNSSTTNFVVAR